MPRRPRPSGATAAIRALEQAGVDFVLHPYEHDPRATSYGVEAAQVLGIPEARVFKTLVADADGRLVVAVVPVSGLLDLKALARALGARRAAMADPGAAERATGYVVGGISPLGQKRPHPTVLDASALGHETVLVSAGRRGLDVELAPAELVTLTSAQVAAIAQA
ncbi:Cys-tRNA(Pro) deacylase [Nocardioides cynanchi]|uniref:Cys-tRNA(Pro) deacylase n=1 Tax=Nocardioides cynanchi TaxID=2558918 RepID=UPI001245A90D|nr:Cys-tRNA(Pro) deacylase [Nocardioides cynanchi]